MLTTDQVDELAYYKKKLSLLKDCLSRLDEQRIKYDANLEMCFFLLREANQGDGNAITALAYAIKVTAKQVRLSIMKKPRHAQMMMDIVNGTQKSNELKVGKFRALNPFASKVFEQL